MNALDRQVLTDRSSRGLVVSLSAAVIGYSLCVLWVVASAGDVGIRCVFETLIKAEVGPAYRWFNPDASTPERLTPRIGDRLTWIGRADGTWGVSIADGDYTTVIRAQRLVGREPDGSKLEIRWVADPGGVPEPRRAIAEVRSRPFASYVWSLIWFAQEMVIFAIGALVFWRRPRDLSARVFFVLCAITVGAFMGGYHWSEIVVSRPLIFLFPLLAMLLPVVSLHFYLVFPRPNPLLLLYRRLVLAAIYGFSILWLASLWFFMAWLSLARPPLALTTTSPASVTAAEDHGISRLVESMTGWRPDRLTLQRIVENLALGYVVYSLLVFALCIACLVYSLRRARNRSERSQVQWILLASVLSSFLIAYLMRLAILDSAALGLDRAAWPMYVVSLLYTVAYAASITRYRLGIAEEFLNRGVRYVLVSVLAGVVYSGLLVAGTFLITTSWSSAQTSREGVVVAATALAVLALSGLLRDRVQRVFDRRFAREKYRFDRAMRRMSEAVERLVDPNALGLRLLESAAEVHGLDWGAFYLRSTIGGPLKLAASLGPVPEQTKLADDNALVRRVAEKRLIRVPGHGTAGPADAATDAMIALGGEVALALDSDGVASAMLVLGPKRSGRPFEDDEIAFLGALCSVGSLALRTAATHQTLENLNQQLRDKVDKIAEQQRRILILQDKLLERPDVETGSVKGGASRSDAPGDAFEAIRGSSTAMRRALELVRKAAGTPSAVLITGESGTGKELLAEAIHRASPRRDNPFVKVHCAALSQSLLESELFGHVRGAFTGADRDRIGRFQQADGGTLFLDEIGDVNHEVQTKLLRVLQTKTFERVGSSQTLAVDVRIVAATNQDLPELIRGGRFREDLFYRLNVIGIRTPPLRDRPDDVFELAVHFLGEVSRRLGKTVTHLEDDAIEALVAHSWPGNVRELENVIERAVVLADGPAIGREDLPPEVLHGDQTKGRSRRRPVPVLTLSSRARSARHLPVDGDASAPVRFDDELEAYERHRLQDALAVAGGNKSEASRLLGIPRSTLVSKLKKYGLADDGLASG